MNRKVEPKLILTFKEEDYSSNRCGQNKHTLARKTKREKILISEYSFVVTVLMATDEWKCRSTVQTICGKFHVTSQWTDQMGVLLS